MNPMTTRKTQGSHRRLRRGLLVALLLALAGLAGLFLLGRQGAPDDEAEMVAPGAGGGAPGAGAADRDANVVASSDAFDFTQSLEGRPVFSVHGDRFQTTRDGKIELEGVRFEIFREATSYSVASDRATYDSNSQEALLTGNVRLAGGELAVESGRMQLSRGGKLLVAEGPIALSHGRVQAWSRDADGLPPWSLDEVTAALGTVTGDEVVVLAEPGGPRAFAVRRG
jgi:hypothetical protein